MNVLSWIRLLSVLTIISSFSVWSQSYPLPRSIPYTETFGSTAFSTHPSGWATWNGISGTTTSSLAAAESSTPSGDAVIQATSATQSGGGCYGYGASGNGRLYIQTSSNALNGACQVALAISTVGYTSIQLDYDVEVIVANPRTIGLVAQYRVGAGGSWLTLPGVGNPFSQAGGTPGVKITASLALPAAALDHPVVYLRWATWRGSETGSSSGIAIDNVVLTGTGAPLPIVQTGSPSSIALTEAEVAGSVDPMGQSVMVYFDFGPTSVYGHVVQAIPPTASGTGIVAVSAQLTGLLPGTSYHYRVRVEAGSTVTGADSVFSTPSAPLGVEPTIQSTLSVHARGAGNLSLNCTGGNGSRRLILARRDSAVSVLPQDGVTYAASVFYPASSVFSDGSRTVYSGPDTGIVITGLEDGVRYHFAVFEYHDNGYPGTENYLTIMPGMALDSTLVAPGLLLFEEEADAASGTPLTSRGWTAHSSSTILPIQIVGTGLSMPGFPGTGIGGGIGLGVSGEDVHHVFPTQSHGYSVLVAVMVNLTSVTSSGDYFLHLGPSVIAASFRARVYAKSDGAGGILFGVNTSGSPVTSYAATSCSLGQTHLLVLRYRIETNGTAHSAELFLNPSLMAPLPSQADAKVSETANVPADIGCIALRQGSSGASPVGTVDGIRVGTRWGAVSGFPLYTTSGTATSGTYSRIGVLQSHCTLGGPVRVREEVELRSGSVSTGGYLLLLDSTATISGEMPAHAVSGQVEITTRAGTGPCEPGGLGAEVGGGPDDLGLITVRRWSGPGEAVTSGTHAGINRRWRITSEYPPTTGRDLTLEWMDDEDNGIDASMARMWRSPDTGHAWAPLGLIQNALVQRRISAFTPAFSEFTVGDAVHPLPVELVRFGARRIGTGILLTWETATESNCESFSVERQEYLRDEWSPIAEIAGMGTSNHPTRYETIDEQKSQSPGPRRYRLLQKDRDGKQRFCAEVEVQLPLAMTIRILPSHPEPCAAFTDIGLVLDRESRVGIEVVNSAGQCVLRLAERILPAGTTQQRIPFPESLPDGIYFVQIRSGNHVMQEKVLRLRD